MSTALDDFIDEQRAARIAFEAEVRGKLRSLDRRNRTVWLYGAIGWIVAAGLVVALTEVMR